MLAGVGDGGARLHALTEYVVGEEAGGGAGSSGGGLGPREENRQTGWWEKPPGCCVPEYSPHPSRFHPRILGGLTTCIRSCLPPYSLEPS